MKKTWMPMAAGTLGMICGVKPVLEAGRRAKGSGHRARFLPVRLLISGQRFVLPVLGENGSEKAAWETG